jgi:hypothetical protein
MPPANTAVWLRGVFVAGLGWMTLRLAGAGHGCFLDLVNLAFHEAGHLFLAPFGETLHVLGGTLGQLAVPAGLAAYFLRARRDRFAAAACVWWAGENLVHIAVYMADARDLALPLVGGGEHDWNTLFYSFGLLGQDSVAAIAGVTRALGVLVMWGALGGAACLVSQWRASGADTTPGETNQERRGDDPRGGQTQGASPQPQTPQRPRARRAA